MANDLFGINWEELYEKFMNLQNIITDKYNDILKNVKRYDLDTEEGYEAFIKDAADIRKDLEMEDSYFNQKLITLLDKVVKSAMEKHEAKKLKPLSEELVNTEVSRNIKENYGKVNTGKACSCENKKDVKSIDWPSSHLNYKQARNIQRLVDEYMQDMVEPYVDSDEETLDNMANGLYEFAAWLLNHDDE